MIIPIPTRAEVEAMADEMRDQRMLYHERHAQAEAMLRAYAATLSPEALFRAPLSEQGCYDLGYYNPSRSSRDLQFHHLVLVNAYVAGQADRQNQAPRNLAYDRSLYDPETFERLPPQAAPEKQMTEDQIKYMVDRFLGWRLPENFSPDAGISFERFGNKDTPHQYEHRPSGTNLLDADQATAMVRCMLEGLPSSPQAALGNVPEREAFWLIERDVSPPQYVSLNSAGWHHDVWQARRFRTEREAHDYWRIMSGRNQFKVIEHMFINKAPQINAVTCKDGLQVQAAPVADGKPTSTEINALPQRIRDYIAALETECDPAGTIRENFRLREENAGLRALDKERAEGKPDFEKEIEEPSMTEPTKEQREMLIAWSKNVREKAVAWLRCSDHLHELFKRGDADPMSDDYKAAAMEERFAASNLETILNCHELIDRLDTIDALTAAIRARPESEG